MRLDMWYEKILFSTYCALAAVIVGVMFLPRLSSFAKLIWFLLIANVSVDISATYIDVVLSKNTLSLYSIYTAIEFAFILYIFSKINLYKKYQLVIYLSIFFVLVFSIINFKYIQGDKNFNTYTFALGGFLVSLFSYLNIRYSMKIDGLKGSDIMLWFSVANIIFYIGALPVLLSAPIAKEIPDSLGKSLFIIKDVTYSLWSLLIAIGFICQKKEII
jgi:hypothetical protein